MNPEDDSHNACHVDSTTKVYRSPSPGSRIHVITYVSYNGTGNSYKDFQISLYLYKCEGTEQRERTSFPGPNSQG